MYKHAQDPIFEIDIFEYNKIVREYSYPRPASLKGKVQENKKVRSKWKKILPRLNKRSLPFYYVKSGEDDSCSRCNLCYCFSCSAILFGLFFSSLVLFRLCDKSVQDISFGNRSRVDNFVERKISEKVTTIPTWDELATYYPAKLLDDEDDQVLEKVHSKEQKPNCDLAFLIVIGTSIIVISLMLLVYLIKCKT